MSGGLADPFVAALILGATAANDNEVAHPALAPALRARVEAGLAEVASARARGREAALSALLHASATPPAAGLEAAPARARSVLATLVPRALGSAWMREAGPPRVGFRVSASLRALVLAIPGDAWRE